VDHKQELVFQGTDMYVRTTRALVGVLRDERMRLQDETLAVCMLLSAYEVSVDPFWGGMRYANGNSCLRVRI
jgi:hypothetical protein